MSEIVIQGTGLLYDMLTEKGVVIAHDCGGAGTCGKCKIQVISGNISEMSDYEKSRLSKDEQENGIRLACLCRVSGEAVVKYAYKKEDITYAGYEKSQLSVDKTLLLVDLGTTTIKIDIYESNGLKRRASIVNPLAVYGADIISRLEKISTGKIPLIEMQDKLLKSICAVINGNEADAVIAGNSAMSHIAAGKCIETLLTPPYEPAFYEIEPFTLTSHGKHINVRLLPNIGGFVGGDAYADILFLEDELKIKKTTLLIDIGTNSEVILFKDNTYFTASSPSGPAFEGAAIECGMAAVEGAVTDIEIENTILVNTVMNAPAAGICGTGIVSIAAELLKTGGIDIRGTFADKIPLFPILERRINNGKFYLNKDVYVSQKDIREFQNAKAALKTTIEILMETAGIKKDDIEKIIITGNFGSNLDIKNVIYTKIIPDFEQKRIKQERDVVLKGLEIFFMKNGNKNINSAIKHIDIVKNGKFNAKFVKNIDFS